jgi:hypothetical protein
MKLAEQNYQAFASAMTEEMNGLKTDIAKDTNRILWGDGTGKIAVLAAEGVATNTIDVTSGMDLVEIGMVIDIADSSDTITATVNRTITAITNNGDGTGTITIDGATVTTSADDYIVRTGNLSLEPQGLESLVVESSTLFNLATTTEPKWGSVVDSTGGALSESAMIAMCDRLRQNGGRPSVIFTDLPTRRAYFNLLTTQRRFTGTKTFEGGFSGLAFSYDDDIPVMTDVDATQATMYFLREDDFKIYRESAWKWEDTDGSVWKWVTNFDAFEALMKQYWEFAIERRNTQGKMTGITPG